MRYEDARRLTEIEIAVREAVPEWAHLGEVMAVFGKLLYEIATQAIIESGEDKDD